MMVFNRRPIIAVIALYAVTFVPGAHTFELYEDGASTLTLDLEAGAAAISSQKAYAQTRSNDSSPFWQEYYAKYGLSGTQKFALESSAYAAFNVVSSLSRGDGDAAGFTVGDELETAHEDAYIGWRSGKLLPWLGEDGIELSIGSQYYAIGDSFLIGGDYVDFGEGFDALADQGLAPRGISRGGAYYLAPRTAFQKTAILRLGGATGLHAEGFWL